MSKSTRLNKEILSRSIHEVLEMDDTDLVNNVVDILTSSDVTNDFTTETRPYTSRKNRVAWSFINRLATVSEFARKVTDRLFPVPKASSSFYADIW